MGNYGGIACTDAVGAGISKPKERLAAVWHNHQFFAKYLWEEDVEIPATRLNEWVLVRGTPRIATHLVLMYNKH